MSFSMQNYAYLLIVLLYFVTIGLPISLAANSIPIAESKGIAVANVNQGTSSVKTDPLDPTMNSGYYFVQTQSESTTSEAKTEGNLGKSNDTGVTESAASSINNGSPPTESTDKSNPGPKATSVRCEGTALCVTGEVVKVINGKTFYVNIKNKVYKVELALIGLPVQSEDAMRAATTFTRNTCLGSNVLIDQDDGQKVDSFIAQVYCSPTKHLNSMLLQTGYVELDKSQCQASEFSQLDWAKSYGC
jgi:endonuclease YncB( thermonuclease family)